MVNILIVSAFLSRFGPLHRRITFFINFLNDYKINVKCASSTLMTNRGIMVPDKHFIKTSVLVSSRSPLVSIINIILSFPLILFILLLRPRIVIVIIPDSCTLIPTYIGAKLVGAKLIVDVTDPFEEVQLSFFSRNKLEKTVMRMIRKVNYALYARANIILAVTNTLKEFLRRRFGREVILVPNGADLSLFKPVDRNTARRIYNLDDESLVIAYTGKLGGYYDISKFLYSIRDVKENLDHKPNVKVLLAGPVVDERTNGILNSPTFKDSVVYLGMLDVDMVRTLLSAADLGLVPRVVNPVFDYAIPVKFYEYVACGLPVIALARQESELAQTVLEHGLGFVCEPDDTMCMKKILSNILVHRKVLQHYRINVLRFRKRVDWRVGAKTLLKIVMSQR